MDDLRFGRPWQQAQGHDESKNHQEVGTKTLRHGRLHDVEGDDQKLQSQYQQLKA